MLYQQGDVLLESVDSIPAHAMPVTKRDGRHILAEGEVTGHAHVVEDDIELYEKAGVLYCRAAAPFTIKHEEHKPITVQPGAFEIRRVREFDHFSQEAFEVMD